MYFNLKVKLKVCKVCAVFYVFVYAWSSSSFASAEHNVKHKHNIFTLWCVYKRYKKNCPSQSTIFFVYSKSFCHIFVTVASYREKRALEKKNQNS